MINARTTMGGIIAAAGVAINLVAVWGLVMKTIDLSTCVAVGLSGTALIGTGGTWVGVTAKDGNRGSDALSEVANAVVERAADVTGTVIKSNPK